MDQLGDAEHVTTGAKGIAYSCLLDCLCASGRHQDGWKALNEAMGKGVALQVGVFYSLGAEDEKMSFIPQTVDTIR